MPFTLPENPYEILGVSKTAQIPEIRTAYRKLVLKCHPDKVTDPTQKAIKAEEFQKVQKAYELLSNENEREKYEDMVRANELEKENAERRRQRDREFTPGRTPPRSYDSDYGRSPHLTVHVKGDPGYKVRTAEPREPPSFQKSSTWTSGSKSPYTSHTRTPPRSYEDNINSASYSSYEDIPRESRDSRRSRKVYDEKPSREEEKRARRKEQEDNERAEAKARRKEAERREAEKEASRKALKEQEKRDKEARKEQKRREEKMRDQDRRRDTEEKRSRNKPSPYVDEEEIVYTPKSEKKSKSSSRIKEIPQVHIREDRDYELRSERDVKHATTMDFATQYLARSKAAPGLQRAQTYSYNVRHASPERPPPAVATPPPAANGRPLPPQMPSMGQTLEEDSEGEQVMRSAARRRMSHDTPRTREKISSSHKKSSSREAEYTTESGRAIPKLSKSATMPTAYTHQSIPAETSPPKPSRSKTEYPSRPGPNPLHNMMRQQTWAPGGEDHRERSRSRPLQTYDDEESEEDYRPRRSHRTRSPEDLPNTFTYKVENGRAKPSRTASYMDDPAIRNSRSKSYYPEANQGRPLEHRPAMYSHESYSAQPAFKVKTARHYDMSDVHVADQPYSYTPRDLHGYA